MLFYALSLFFFFFFFFAFFYVSLIIPEDLFNPLWVKVFLYSMPWVGKHVNRSEPCIQPCFLRSTGNTNMLLQPGSQLETVQRTIADHVFPVQVLGPQTAAVWEVQNQPESWPPLAVPQVLPGHPLARCRRHRHWLGVGRQDHQQDSC